MDSETPESDASNQVAGAPQTGQGSAMQSDAKDVDRQSRHDAESKHNEDSADQPSTEKPSADFPRLSPEMERYMRMEAFLLKHRKEWESKHDPVLDAAWEYRDELRRDPRVDLYGPWNRIWDFKSIPRYNRPNPFELTNNLSTLQSAHSAEEEDEFDISIDYGAARNRLRKNFEWDMDRIFLVEELAIRKRKQEEAQKVLAQEDISERPSASKEEESEGPPDHDNKKKTGPALKLNEVGWFAFRRLSDKSENDSCVVDVLLGDPIIEDGMGPMFGRRVRRHQKPRGSELGKAMRPGQASLPERIRINSAVLKKILASMLSADPDSFGDFTSFVIVRPFKSLFHCYDNIRTMIEKLEDKFSKEQESTTPINDDTTSIKDVHVEKQDAEGQKGNSLEKSASSVLESEMEVHPGSTQAQTLEHEEVEDDISDEEDEDHQEKDGDPNDPTQSEVALQHLKVLHDFMESRIKAKIMFLQTNECRKVFFSDLWYLFRPGQEVIGRDGKQAYRIVQVSSQRHRKTKPWDVWRWDNDLEKNKKKKGPFSLSCVYIDFDGSSIGPVSIQFDFKQFDGEAEITSLPVYPLRLHSLRKSEVSDADWRELEVLVPEKRFRQYLVNRGAKFLNVLGIKPMYYAGPTLGVRDDIESQVVIDFETAFSAEDGHGKSWKPNLEMIIGAPVSEEDDLYERDCSGDCCRWDMVYNDTYIDDKERSRYVNTLLPGSDGTSTQPSIAVFPRLLTELKDDANRTGYSVFDDELLIMSYRVFGFVLRHRHWAELDISHLTDLYAHRRPVWGHPHNKNSTFEGKKYKTAFDNLVLEKKQKPMIQALVAQHLRDKEHRAGQTVQMDIVKGKGKGLILLLHGAPGVGKTSTAGETLSRQFLSDVVQFANTNQRGLQNCSIDLCSKSLVVSLYNTTSPASLESTDQSEGDLGTTAKEVEKALDLNFTLANRWDCILLLDEADVFLAQRNKEDFQRNGLVAVFLRVLEYYAGVLFLTTNRIGDFDEAFTSRIHISLYYPELDCEKTIQVFNINIEMIEERFNDKERTIDVDIDDIRSFARDHYNNNEDARWNGRQIRNACQTALALAEFDAQGGSHMAVYNPDAVVRLKLSHFETVQQAYLDFAHYMDSVYGASAETRAQENQVRAMLDMMGESGRRLAKVDSFAAARSKSFRDEVRAKSNARAPQAVSPPVSQPAMAQPFAQPMFAQPGNQQYFPGSVQQQQPQVYYPNMAAPQPIYPQYAQPMGATSMRQQAAPSQSMNPAHQQPQFHQSQIQPGMQQASYLPPNPSQVMNSLGLSPNNNLQQAQGMSEALSQTPPSQRSHPQPAPAGGTSLLQHNVEEMYSAGSPQARGAGHAQQQQQQQQQSAGAGGPPPMGQMGGTSGYPHMSTGAPMGQGQWPGAQGMYTGGEAGQ
ncbi:hypothetical protein PG996_007986 [Apiospora saccharicola]|uniref:AAA+ ATPase domain-containing protein n=1 Tax=Apiospora saccharicola TaxID=335842 RepID=A0ABR1UZS3_9PEZI